MRPKDGVRQLGADAEFDPFIQAPSVLPCLHGSMSLEVHLTEALNLTSTERALIPTQIRALGGVRVNAGRRIGAGHLDVHKVCAMRPQSAGCGDQHEALLSVYWRVCEWVYESSEQ